MKYLDDFLNRKEDWFKLNVEDNIHKIESDDYKEVYWVKEQIKRVGSYVNGRI